MIFTSAYEVKKLSELCFQSGIKNTELNSYEVFSVTNSKGFKLSFEQFSKQVFSKDLKNYKNAS